MFERFTHEARAVVVEAVQRAGGAAADRVDTDHLLLGVAAGDSSAARLLAESGATPQALSGALSQTDDARLLGTLGIDVERVRSSVERVFGPGSWQDEQSTGGRRRRRSGHFPFSADAKKALELSLREAIAMRSKRIEAGHILLGLIVSGGRGAEALRAVGIDTADLRRRTADVLRRAS